MKRLTGTAKQFNFLRATKTEYVLVSLLALVAYLAMAILRNLDDNTLVSWRWVFADLNPVSILVFHIIGIAVAFILSRFSLEKFPVFILSLFSFLAGMLFWGTPEVIVDASRYFTQAKHLETYGLGYFLSEWGHDIVAWTDLPLIPMLYGLIFKLFGESRFYIQLFTTALFTGTVVLSYKIGRTLWDEATGFLGGLLLLGIPYVFTQVPLMLVDVPAMFFLTLAVYAYIKALRQRGIGSIILSSIAIALAFFSKYSIWLMLSILVVILFIFFLEETKRGRKFSERSHFFRQDQQRMLIYRGFAIGLVSTLLIGIVISFKFDVISEQIKLLHDYQQPGLRRWGESFFSTFFFQIHPFLSLSALFSALVAFKKRDLRFAIISWLVILIFLLRIERIRYIIMVFPMLALMASYGLQAIRDISLRRFFVLCAVTSSLAVAFFGYVPFLTSVSIVNLEEAGKYLRSSGAQRIEVFTVPQKDFMDINPAVSISLLDLFVDQEIAYRLDHTVQPPEKIKESPLRFTWEYKNPRYYAYGDLPGKTVIVVISGSADEPLPDTISRRVKGYRLSKKFTTSTRVFRYRTMVRIYEPVDNPDGQTIR